MAEQNRAQAIAALRAIADLCEREPGLPVPSAAHVCVRMETDEQEHAELDRIVGLLDTAGATVVRDDHGGYHNVYGYIGDGAMYSVFSIDAATQAAWEARQEFLRPVTSERASA